MAPTCPQAVPHQKSAPIHDLLSVETGIVGPHILTPDLDVLLLLLGGDTTTASKHVEMNGYV